MFQIHHDAVRPSASTLPFTATSAPPGDLVEAIRHFAETQPDRRALTFLADGQDETAALTYGGFDRAVRALAARLQADGLAGERALLVFEPGLDFVVAFVGCLFAGVVPVPAYPPEPHRMAHTLARLEGIVADADPSVVLTSPLIRGFAEGILAKSKAGALAELTWLTPDQTGDADPDDWQMPSLTADTVAFLQYTSGSTGRPRGVMVTHGGIWANLAMSRAAYGLSSDSVFVSWLPLYHDMGLVGKLLNPLGLGAESWLMPPGVFLRAPSRWLALVSRVGGTITAAPNFAYDLAVRKTPAAVRDALDLSRLTVMVNGAEPVRRATVRRFEAYFAPAGLRPGVVTPSYGMAEVGLFVSCARAERRGGGLRVDAAALEQHRVQPVDEAAEGVDLVSCGVAWAEGVIEVVDPQTGRRAAPGAVGEIWLAGPHVAAGYWRRPEETGRTFGGRVVGAEGEGPFLRTGDLGFVHDGELYVTGRMKDVIIVRGRNLYPHDVEHTLDGLRARLPELRPGCAAAFPVEVDGRERLVVCQEVDPRRAPDHDPRRAAAAMRAAITEAHGVEVYGVVLLAKGSLPKTSSGKVMRFACRAAFTAGFADGSMTVLARDLLADAPTAPAAAPGRRDPAATRLEAWMVATLARELGRAPGPLAAQLRGGAPFASLGVDSLVAVQLVDALEEKLGRALPADLLHQHRDLGGLVDHLLSEG